MRYSQCTCTGACNRCRAKISCIYGWLSRYGEGCVSTLPRLQNGSVSGNCCTGSGIVYTGGCGR